MSTTTFQVLDALKNAQTVLAGSNIDGELSAGATLYDENGNELAKPESTTFTAGTRGLPMLGVRKDTPVSIATSDGDYTMPIFDADGKLYVNVGTTNFSLAPDFDGDEQSGNWTLSTSGTVTTVNLPDEARYITIYPQSPVRVRFGGSPSAVGSNAFSPGAPVEAYVRRTFVLPAGTSRTMGVISTVTSGVLTVEARP